jgi:hypothetical protein
MIFCIYFILKSFKKNYFKHDRECMDMGERKSKRIIINIFNLTKSCCCCLVFHFFLAAAAAAAATERKKVDKMGKLYDGEI